MQPAVQWMTFLSRSLLNTKSLRLQWLHVLNIMNVASQTWSCNKSLKDYKLLGDNVQPLNLQVFPNTCFANFKLSPQP